MLQGIGINYNNVHSRLTLLRVATMVAFVLLLADHMHRKDVARRRSVKLYEKYIAFLQTKRV